MRKLISLFVLFQIFLFGYAQDSSNTGTYKIFYYPDSNKSSEGYLVNGKPDGWWKSYNEKLFALYPEMEDLFMPESW